MENKTRKKKATSNKKKLGWSRNLLVGTALMASGLSSQNCGDDEVNRPNIRDSSNEQDIADIENDRGDMDIGAERGGCIPSNEACGSYEREGTLEGIGSHATFGDIMLKLEEFATYEGYATAVLSVSDSCGNQLEDEFPEGVTVKMEHEEEIEFGDSIHRIRIISIDSENERLELAVNERCEWDTVDAGSDTSDMDMGSDVSECVPVERNCVSREITETLPVGSYLPIGSIRVALEGLRPQGPYINAIITISDECGESIEGYEDVIEINISDGAEIIVGSSTYVLRPVAIEYENEQVILNVAERCNETGEDMGPDVDADQDSG